MRFPVHVILDATYDKNSASSQYWVVNLYSNYRLPIFMKTKSNYVGKKKISIRYFKKISSVLSERNKTMENIINSESKYKGKYFGVYNILNKRSNINFLRKERAYTKLKYSRSPSFDIVSGGAAAILAGLLGFLISEKFGMELADSGDFYYLFMYLVFVAFSVSPLVIISNVHRSFLNLISIKRLLDFYLTIITIAVIFFKGRR